MFIFDQYQTYKLKVGTILFLLRPYDTRLYSEIPHFRYYLYLWMVDT